MRPFTPPQGLPPTPDVIENARIAHKVAVHFRNNPNPSETEHVIQALHDALYAAMHKLSAYHLMLGDGRRIPDHAALVAVVKRALVAEDCCANNAEAGRVAEDHVSEYLAEQAEEGK